MPRRGVADVFWEKARAMAKGDHLFIFCSGGLYTHHGIDIGDGTVVHLSKLWGPRKIIRTSLDEFCDGQEVYVREYTQCDPPSVVVERAVQRVGEKGYDLIFHNCEHFACWCKTGNFASAQVENVARRVVAGAAKAVTSKFARVIACKGLPKAAVKILSRQSVKLAAKGMTRVASPWLLLADGAQLVIEEAACRLGADPENAKGAGRCVGFLGSAAMGTFLGGSVGALLGVGLWAAGEAVGELVQILLGPATTETLPEAAPEKAYSKGAAL